MSRLVPFRDRPHEVEWLGGRYVLPHHVRDGDSSFRPDLALWLELPRGVIVGSTFGSPDEPLSLATSLDTAMQRPLEGEPRRPSRIRVADDRMAHELRAAAGGIPIVVAPVPELDDTFRRFIEELDAAVPDATYLGGGDIPARAVEELFAISKLLFRSAPWRRVSDQQILRVDVPQLGIAGACLCVIGAAGESFGLLLFSSICDYDAFAETRKGVTPEGHVALRSLSFTPKEELPPPLLREVEEHRWAVAGPDAYPVLFCVDGGSSPLVFTERDVRLMTAVTRAFLAFFHRHRDLFASDDPEPVRETSEGEDGVKVTLTAPYVFDDDDSFATETAPPMREVGRNDPCPCGSGKKYKKCHLDIDAAPRRAAGEVESVHQMDFRLVRAVERFASSRFGVDWLDFDVDDLDPDSLELLLPWGTWTAEVEKRRVADLFLEQHASRLSPEERDWIAAQQASWLSVWEVTAVAPARIEARDLLTGETRSVREELGSRTLRARHTVLARVVDYRGVSYFGGMDSHSLPLPAAASVIDAVRAKLRLRKAAVPVARLRDREIGWFLIDEWADTVEYGPLPPELEDAHEPGEPF